MPKLSLDGCTPEPLMGYLKSLGVLRIVAEQADDDVRGYWSDGVFVVESNLDRDGLIQFFLDEYRPTPIIAPGQAVPGSSGRTTERPWTRYPSVSRTDWPNLPRLSSGFERC